MCGFLVNRPVPRFPSFTTSLWAGGEISPFSPLTIHWNDHELTMHMYISQNLDLLDLFSNMRGVILQSKVKVPGHSRSLQVWMSVEFPKHSSPPCIASWYTALFLDFLPSPQVFEQEVKCPHFPHWQCTEIWKKTWKVIIPMKLLSISRGDLLENQTHSRCVS